MSFRIPYVASVLVIGVTYVMIAITAGNAKADNCDKFTKPFGYYASGRWFLFLVLKIEILNSNYQFK